MALKEYLATDSNKSMMRLTFFITVITGLVLAAGSVAVALWAALNGKAIDLSSVTTIIGLLIGGGFLGKAVQSFSETDTTTTDTTAATTTEVTK